MIDNSISFDDAFDTFLLAKRAENVTPGSIGVYEATRAFWDRRWPAMRLSDITADHVRQWLLWLQGEWQADIDAPTIKSATVHIRFRNMRALFLWCEREDLIPRSPMRNVKAPIVEETIPDVLTEDEAELLLKKVKHNGDRHAFRDYCIHLTFLATGVRLSELVGLNIEHVNLKDGYAKVYGKGRRERIVPLGTRLPLELKRYMLKHRPSTESRALFINDRGDRLEARGVQSLVIRDLVQYVKRTLNRIGPHTYRHTACTFRLRRTRDLKGTAEVMGHTTTRTTERYSHLSHNDVINNGGDQSYSPMDDILKSKKNKEIRYNKTAHLNDD